MNLHRPWTRFWYSYFLQSLFYRTLSFYSILHTTAAATVTTTAGHLARLAWNSHEGLQILQLYNVDVKDLTCSKVWYSNDYMNTLPLPLLSLSLCLCLCLSLSLSLSRLDRTYKVEWALKASYSLSLCLCLCLSLSLSLSPWPLSETPYFQRPESSLSHRGLTRVWREEWECASWSPLQWKANKQLKKRRRGMNGRTFSQNPLKRGKSPPPTIDLNNHGNRLSLIHCKYWWQLSRTALKAVMNQWFWICLKNFFNGIYTLHYKCHTILAIYAMLYIFMEWPSTLNFNVIYKLNVTICSVERYNNKERERERERERESLLIGVLSPVNH